MQQPSFRTRAACGEFILLSVVVTLGTAALSLWFFKPYGEKVMMQAVGFTVILAALSVVPYVIFLYFRVSVLYADNDGLMRVAMTDRLTKVLNRQGFDRKFRDQMRALAGQNDKGLMLLIVDADHFKRINDRLGHPVGDVALKKIAGTLKKLTRNSDAVGRLGGEEFVISLPCSTAEQGEMIADRLRMAIHQLYVGSGPNTAQLSVSIGGVFLRRPQPFQGIYEAADANLYRAKQAGRNRCTISTLYDFDQVRIGNQSAGGMALRTAT